MIGVLVALAGGVGAAVRFLVDGWLAGASERLRLPVATIVINVTGSFLLGVITGWWLVQGADPGPKLVLGTGFLGGYTTFSAASVEAARLARAGRGWSALVHAGVQLLLGLLGAALGLWVGIG